MKNTALSHGWNLCLIVNWKITFLISIRGKQPFQRKSRRNFEVFPWNPLFILCIRCKNYKSLWVFLKGFKGKKCRQTASIKTQMRFILPSWEESKCIKLDLIFMVRTYLSKGIKKKTFLVLTLPFLDKKSTFWAYHKPVLTATSEQRPY